MNENTTNPLLLYSEVIIIKIYKNLLPFEALVVRSAASCSSQNKQGLGLDKNWLWAVCSRSHLAASGGSVAQGRADDQYYQGVSSNGINHIWRLSNRGEQKWNVPVSCEEAMRITAVTNAAVSVAFQVTGLELNKAFFILFYFIFPRLEWNYDSGW